MTDAKSTTRTRAPDALDMRKGVEERDPTYAEATARARSVERRRAIFADSIAAAVAPATSAGAPAARSAAPVRSAPTTSRAATDARTRSGAGAACRCPRCRASPRSRSTRTTARAPLSRATSNGRRAARSSRSIERPGGTRCTSRTVEDAARSSGTIPSPRASRRRGRAPAVRDS